MGIGLKIWDYLNAESWEEYIRMQLEREVTNVAKKLSKDEMVEIKKMVGKINSKAKQ